MADYLWVRAGHHDGLCVLRIVGELDMVTAGDFAERVRTAVPGTPGPVLVDLSGMAFIDAAGARALAAAVRAVPAGRLAGVRSCQPLVRHALDMLGLRLEPASALTGTAPAHGTRELADRVRQARFHARAAAYDASAVMDMITDTSRRLARTRHRTIRAQQQGRLLLARSRAARMSATAPGTLPGPRAG